MPIGPERSDEELMAMLQQQDLGALEALYDRHHRLVLALAYRVLGERESAEEVVQETFLSVWRQAQTYRPERGKVQSWLAGIARHRAIDRVRRTLRPSQLAELDDSLVDQRAAEVWEQADQGVRRERVLEALEALPAEQRLAIELAFYGGLSHQEIAARTGVPLGTTKGRLRLALDKLRSALLDLAPERDEPGRSLS